MRRRSRTGPLASSSTGNDRRTRRADGLRAGKVGTADCVLDANRSSRSHHRAGHPARLATLRTFRRAAASRSFCRLAAKKRPNNRPVRSFSSRACHSSHFSPAERAVPSAARRPRPTNPWRPRDQAAAASADDYPAPKTGRRVTRRKRRDKSATDRDNCTCNVLLRSRQAANVRPKGNRRKPARTKFGLG